MKAEIIIPRLEELLESRGCFYIDYHTRVKRHQKRTTDIAVYIAQELGMPEEDIEKLRIGGNLHDSGKLVWHIGMMYKKREDLSEYENSLIYTHAGASCALIECVIREAGNDVKDLLNGWLPDVLEMIKHHHKDYNGNGYPTSVSGEKASIFAHILRAADSYDAMRSPRIYRSTGKQMKNHKQAMEEIEKNIGTEFHPEIVRAFLRIPQEKLDELYTGVAHLTSERRRRLYGPELSKRITI